MSDAMTRQRWEARRKMIADDFFEGDEANAETVLDSLPYSAIPDWGDVALLMQSMDAAGLLATPEHDAAVAARALREAADEVGRMLADDSGCELNSEMLVSMRDPEYLMAWLRVRASEREGGESDA